MPPPHHPPCCAPQPQSAHRKPRRWLVPLGLVGALALALLALGRSDLLVWLLLLACPLAMLAMGHHGAGQAPAHQDSERSTPTHPLAPKP